MDDATKDIMSKERLHRTRLTVLQSSGKVQQLGTGTEPPRAGQLNTIAKHTTEQYFMARGARDLV